MTDRTISVFVRRHPSCVMRRPLTIEHFQLFSKNYQDNLDQILCVASIKEVEHNFIKITKN